MNILLSGMGKRNKILLCGFGKSIIKYIIHKIIFFKSYIQRLYRL